MQVLNTYDNFCEYISDNGFREYYSLFVGVEVEVSFG